MKWKQIKYYANKAVAVTKEEGIAFILNKTKRKIRNKYAYKRYIRLNKIKELEAENQRNFDFSKYGNKGKIKFSIIVPLYNTKHTFLIELVKSVQAQTYLDWELCMADGSDELNYRSIQKIIEKVKSKDSRIIYRRLEKNLGISENTNAAIDMADGDYLVMLDHDDLLHPSALFENMKVICEKDADVIYSDEMTFENKIENVKSIHFKPDFAIDNLRSNNYICHLMVYKKSLLDKVGKYNYEFDGSQDHDMILRLCEVTNKIEHIPRVLYYWRSHAESVALNVSVKPYVSDAGCRAVKNHLDRVGLKGKVVSSPVFPAIYKIKYEIQGAPLVSIIIPNRNHKEELQRCIESIKTNSAYRNYEILIVENNSNEKSVFDYYGELERLPNTKVINFKGEFNFSAAKNYAISFVKGEYFIFLNNNTKVISGNWIEEMLMFAQRENVGAVGSKLYYSNDTIQHAGIILGIMSVYGHAHRFWEKNATGYMGRAAYAQNLSAITGDCMMISRKAFEEIGYFDEQFSVSFSDVDYCLKIRRKGKLIVWTPYAELYHFQSKPSAKEKIIDLEEVKRISREIDIFKKKWAKELFEGDLYYNKNLTKKYEDFSIDI